METKKIDWIVSLRAIAALAVILHHVSSGWIEGSGGHPEGYRAILDVILVPLLSWWGVPIFIMISGYLLLDPKKDIPLCKLGKYIRRMLVILCTFGLAFAFVEVGFKIGFSHIGYVFQQAIYKLFCGESWAHMWYIYMLLGLYCILPAMKTFTAKASYEEMLFVAGALFIFCSIVPSINCYLDWKLNNILPVKTVYVLYFLIGYLIKVKNISKRLCDTFIVLGG